MLLKTRRNNNSINEYDKRNDVGILTIISINYFSTSLG